MRRSLLSFSVLLAGCYSYAPLETSALRPGVDVRARVTAPTALQIAPLIGVADARLFTGTVINAGTDTMIVEVPTTVRADVGNAIQTLHQRVSVPRTSLLELETRRIDRWRTAVLVGGVAIGVGVIVVKSMRSNPGKEQMPGGGGPSEIRIPLSSLLR